MAGEIVVGWGEYNKLVLELAKKIEASGNRPNQVIAIMRGALVGGVILASRWNVPLAALAVQTRREDRSQAAKEDVYFGREMVNSAPDFGRRPLLFDDLTDSGKTGQITLPWLATTHGHIFTKVITATVFVKTCSVWVPDFYARRVEENPTGGWPWIIHPWDPRP